jgi:hypothetical protein
MMDGKGNGTKIKRMREHQNKPARGVGRRKEKNCTPKRENRHAQVQTTRIAIAEQEGRRAGEQKSGKEKPVSIWQTTTDTKPSIKERTLSDFSFVNNSLCEFGSVTSPFWTSV